MNREIAHTEEYKGYKINIYYSEDYDSPNEWGNNEIFLVYDHRQFMVKRDGFEPRDIWEDNEYLNKVSQYGDYWAFPVEAYIHSGVTLSLYEADLTCQFDSSVTGYVLVKTKIESMAGIEFITESMAKERAEALLETWNQYLSGEVYGFEVIKENFCSHCNTTTEELINSCGGYYGDYEESGCLDEARVVIDNLTKEITND